MADFCEEFVGGEFRWLIRSSMPARARGSDYEITRKMCPLGSALPTLAPENRFESCDSPSQLHDHSLEYLACPRHKYA
jgi:hypothetical protein